MSWNNKRTKVFIVNDWWRKNLSHTSSLVKIKWSWKQAEAVGCLSFKICSFLRGIKEWYFCSELFLLSNCSECVKMLVSVSLDKKTTVYRICVQHAWTAPPGGICYLLGRAEEKAIWQKNQLWWRACVQNNASCSLPGLPKSFTAAPGGSEQFVPAGPASSPHIKSETLHPGPGLPGIWRVFSTHVSLGREVNPVPRGRVVST